MTHQHLLIHDYTYKFNGVFLMISGKICNDLFNKMENKGNYIFGSDM